MSPFAIWQVHLPVPFWNEEGQEIHVGRTHFRSTWKRLKALHRLPGWSFFHRQREFSEIVEELGLEVASGFTEAMDEALQGSQYCCLTEEEKTMIYVEAAWNSVHPSPEHYAFPADEEEEEPLLLPSEMLEAEDERAAAMDRRSLQALREWEQRRRRSQGAPRRLPPPRRDPRVHRSPRPQPPESPQEEEPRRILKKFVRWKHRMPWSHLASFVTKCPEEDGEEAPEPPDEDVVAHVEAPGSPDEDFVAHVEAPGPPDEDFVAHAEDPGSPDEETPEAAAVTLSEQDRRCGEKMWRLRHQVRRLERTRILSWTRHLETASSSHPEELVSSVRHLSLQHLVACYSARVDEEGTLFELNLLMRAWRPAPEVLEAVSREMGEDERSWEEHCPRTVEPQMGCPLAEIWDAEKTPKLIRDAHAFILEEEEEGSSQRLTGMTLAIRIQLEMCHLPQPAFQIRGVGTPFWYSRCAVLGWCFGQRYSVYRAYTGEARLHVACVSRRGLVPVGWILEHLVIPPPGLHQGAPLSQEFTMSREGAPALSVEEEEEPRPSSSSSDSESEEPWRERRSAEQ